MAMTLNSEEQQRVNNIYNEREKALSANNSLYEGLINQAGDMRNQQNEFLSQQEAIQNAQLDKNLEVQRTTINQQKEEAGKNKDVETNKALNDYTSYINPYGLKNEQLYSAGLGNSGVSETSKLGAYTTYQNRVATSNNNYQNIIAQYNIAMDEAERDNDAQKAQNALNKLKLQLQNNQDYLSNVASLSEAKLKYANSINASYDEQYNSVYSQILKERQLEEEARQFNATLSAQKALSSGSGSSSSSSSSSGGGLNSGSSSNKSSTATTAGTAKVANAVSSGISSMNNALNSVLNAFKGGISDNTELYAYSSPSKFSSTKAKNWYMNEFEKHSYKLKDLRWVLKNAISNGKIKEEDANRIYAIYGVK